MKYFIAALALCSGLALFAYWNCGHPMRYDLSGGLRRWVVIQYENSSCPLLARDGVFLVVPVPPSGQVCTSSAHPRGWVYARFEYVYSDGRRQNLSMRTGSDPPGEVQVYLLAYQPREKWEVDFVGTKEEALHWGSPPYPWHRESRP
jgi:hypothetical protein